MASTQKTVMIIEDEPDAAELFAEMMRVNGYRVIKMFSSAPAIGPCREASVNCLTNSPPTKSADASSAVNITGGNW